MTKYLAIPAIVGSLVAAPVGADTGDTAPIRAASAWNYDGYRVELAGVSQETVGPFIFGSRVFLAEPDTFCGAAVCDHYTLYALSGGMKTEIADVPRTALDPMIFGINDGRLVYPRTDSERRRVDVIELDLDTLQETVLAEDLVFNQLVDLKVFVDGNKLYFEPTFERRHRKTNKMQLISTVHTQWSDDESPRIIGRQFRWEYNREEILDVRGHDVLMRMTFPGGHKQLWMMNRVTDKITAVPDTWTYPDGQIGLGRIQEDGTIEYFKDYTRYSYHPDTHAVPVEHPDERLNWFAGDFSEVYQRAGGRYAWISPEDTLYLKDGHEAVKIAGPIADRNFRLEENRLFYATADGGGMYDIHTGERTELPITVTHSQGDMLVGTDAVGDIHAHDLATAETVRVGYGEDASVTDRAHAYWRGTDGNLYEATLRPSAEGADSLVKFGDGARVYLVDGEDALHWIASESVAVTLFGADWKDQVETLPGHAITRYRNGSVIQTGRDFADIR